ncbi:polyphosphate kinase 1 [Roseiflexus castenholzii]|uniref:Polyphosphate kinase n=1 Tax=Roseiflexus castenholzii (strain DSM 13941 / HLO8) TaxID=383372 RepID=A7NPU3_ROSCS|nr:polyphosphate kinase 1 [Roseiflexus castenholzii]ABU59589.1 Polyphosphate kinase [Roseiflexus castenholzii DSM 13941]
MASVEFETIEHDMTNLATASPYFNRELSWLEFNRRVLEEAMDERHPLLERVKFLSIFSTNLDEFFMIRVAGLKQQVAAGVVSRSLDGMTPAEQLAAIRRAVIPLVEQHRACWLDDVRPKLCQQGIHVLDYHELTPEQRAKCAEYFEREVFPVLTPLAIDPAHPFPHISNLSLNLAVVINDPEEGELFARVKVPAVLPRFVPIEGGHCDTPDDVPPERRHCFTWLEQVITANVSSLFPGEEIVECYLFRITRNADMEIEEEEADDLLRVIEEGVRQRRFGAVVRLQVQYDMPERVRNLLLNHLKLTPDDVYEMRGPLGLSDLVQLMKIDRPDLKDPPFYPILPAPLQHARSTEELFAAIRQHDILLHHPFHSFQPLVALIQAAAEDPNVLAIKQTLYRVGSNSPIVKALMHAREQDKQVTVLVELKARFDEENNIIWAKQLERAGVHVVYGLVGLKTHAKLALIVRREHDGLRRYVHLGTGNYNATTARIYTDLGLLTARTDIAADVSELFNHLTGFSRQRRYRKLLVAPVSMRECLAELIEREIAHAQAGRPAHLIFKCNSIVDKKMIDLLYRASQAGVTIELIVRGICCLRPGVPGLSERITVRSIVGRFLEHSRIYYFGNNGNPDIYLGSADLMERNLDRRVETLFPVESPGLKEEIRHLLDVYMRDTSRARLLMPDGSYARARPRDGEEPFDSQAFLSRDNMTPR